MYDIYLLAKDENNNRLMHGFLRLRLTGDPGLNSTISDTRIKLINKRSHIYSKALYEIKCDNLTKGEIVNKILEIYETN